MIGSSQEKYGKATVYPVAKRLLDIAAAATLLAALAPVLATLFVAIRIETPGGALFTQARVGRRGRTFTIFKFRTFFSDRHGIFPDEEIRAGDPRVTPLGQFLRLHKLDELPQLLNVLRGDMSLVGPRPIVPEQGDQYGPNQNIRLEVPPGMTGLAQISGNAWLSWPDRMDLDRWYVENRSFLLDLRILAHTFRVVLEGEHLAHDPIGIRRPEAPRQAR